MAQSENKKGLLGLSLVVQWLRIQLAKKKKKKKRIHLAMQGTEVQCLRVTEPMRRNY